jgi:uncharacterized membrane protein YfcA
MQNKIQKPSPKGTNYLVYVFQMGILIFLGAYGGIKLDEKTGNHYIFVILFSLIAIALSMYYIIRKEIPKKPKNE